MKFDLEICRTHTLQVALLKTTPSARERHASAFASRTARAAPRPLPNDSDCSEKSERQISPIGGANTPKIVNGQRNPATNPRCLKMKTDQASGDRPQLFHQERLHFVHSGSKCEPRRSCF